MPQVSPLPALSVRCFLTLLVLLLLGCSHLECRPRVAGQWQAVRPLIADPSLSLEHTDWEALRVGPDCTFN